MSKTLFVFILNLGVILLAEKKDTFGLEVNSYILSLYNKQYHCIKEPSAKFCTNGDKSRWVINGLWPNNKEGGQVNYCATRNFTYDKIKPKMSQSLEKYWVNYSNKTNSELYKNEWEKHGSCLDFNKFKVSLDKEEYFFNKALQLRKDFNPELPNKSITLRDLNSLFNKSSKDKKIQIICQKDPRNEKVQLIDEVRILLDSNMNVIDYLKQDSCQKSLLIKLDNK
jgi:ribonuclease I